MKGYIAIISTIIISILLMTITLTVSSTGFFSRANILDAEFKDIVIIETRNQPGDRK